MNVLNSGVFRTMFMQESCCASQNVDKYTRGPDLWELKPEGVASAKKHE